MVYIQAFLALIPLIKTVVDWIKDAGVENPAKFITDLHGAIENVRTTKDPKAIQDLIKQL